ncbi:hypothetical protein ACHAXT_002439 [Thalassiosira profunda]
MKTALALSFVGAAAAFAPNQPPARAPTSLAFFGTAKTAALKSSPLAEEARELYNAKYNKGGSRPKFFFESWGMPASYAERAKELSSDRQEEALKMVRIQPGVLAFTKENFKPSLEAFGEKFGYEESKDDDNPQPWPP